MSLPCPVCHHHADIQLINGRQNRHYVRIKECKQPAKTNECFADSLAQKYQSQTIRLFTGSTKARFRAQIYANR